MHQALLARVLLVVVAIVWLRRAVREKRSFHATSGEFLQTLGVGVVFLSLAAPRLIPDRFQSWAGTTELGLVLVAITLFCYCAWSDWHNADK
jgi:uncharacterized membrane protein